MCLQICAMLYSAHMMAVKRRCYGNGLPGLSLLTGTLMSLHQWHHSLLHPTEARWSDFTAVWGQRTRGGNRVRWIEQPRRGDLRGLESGGWGLRYHIGSDVPQESRGHIGAFHCWRRRKTSSSSRCRCIGLRVLYFNFFNLYFANVMTETEKN